MSQAIVQSGIPIHKRLDLPDHLVPPDGLVELEAKIAAGCAFRPSLAVASRLTPPADFSASKVVNKDDLVKTVGRGCTLRLVSPRDPSSADDHDE